MEDVHAILELGNACRGIMLEQATKTGVIGNVHLGCNILIPKPYTPWQREPMDDERSLKRKISVLKKGAAQLPNLTLSMMPPRQAIWQTYISRARLRRRRHDRTRRSRPDLFLPCCVSSPDHIHPEVFQPFPRSCAGIS